MAISFKKYILKKLGLLRSLSADQRNRNANQLNNALNRQPTPKIADVNQEDGPGEKPADGSDGRPELASFQLRPHEPARDPGAGSAEPRPHEPAVGPNGPPTPHPSVNSPRQASRRFFQRSCALDHSRVSPARRRPAAEPPLRDPGHLKVVRNRRLMKEYREITRSVARQAEPPFTVQLVDDSLFEWNIQLFSIDRTSDLYRDLRDLRIRGIQLNMTFPENFPFSPPFLRVLSPRIERGFVMEGGAICMELLTPRGWASAYTVEAIIMQFAASLVKGQGRVDRGSKKPKAFTKRSAENSFKSIVKTHEKYGWVTPPLTDG